MPRHRCFPPFPPRKPTVVTGEGSSFAPARPRLAVSGIYELPFGKGKPFGASFERTAALQPASNVRFFPSRFGHVRADQINNWDLSTIKNTAIREGINFQSAEFLNATRAVCS